MANDQRRTGSYSLKRGGMPADDRARLTAQHQRYGGINWGAAFFGWLSANGLAVLLLAVISAAGVAIGLTTTGPLSREQLSNPPADSGAIGLGGAIALLVILAIAYYAGGYVAGRMSRFDGARQGLAVWLIGLLVVVLLAGAGALFGAEYNVLARLDLPRIPVDEGTATTGAIIALVAIALVTALAAVLGGKTGERYHRRIDRTALGTQS
jgi:hypothetical protein